MALPPSYVSSAGMFCNFSELYKRHVDILRMMDDVHEAVALVAVMINAPVCKELGSTGLSRDVQIIIRCTVHTTVEVKE
jgi:hypothetical protein